MHDQHPGGNTSFGEERIVSIKFAEPGCRLRRIVRRGNEIPTGKYPSAKNDCMCQWQSIGERNAFKILDACPSVLSFESQFVEIVFSVNGENYKHYPDIFIRRDHSEEMVEVKPLRYAILPFNLMRTRILARLLPAHGYEYRLFLNDDLSREPRLSTISRLNRLGRRRIAEVEKERLRRLLLGMTHFSWGDVLNGLFGNNGKHYIAMLILKGDLWLDFNEGLSESTPILVLKAGFREDELYLTVSRNEELERWQAYRYGSELETSAAMSKSLKALR